MKKLCVEKLRYGGALFLPGSEYEVLYLREGYLFLTGNGGTPTDMPVEKFRDYFI